MYNFIDKVPALLVFSAEIEGISCCKVDVPNKLGIVPSAYKNRCSNGLVWVEWKKICIRA